MKSLIVFHGHGISGDWLTRLLRPGFKHVFCAIDDGNYWIRIDGQAGLPVIEAIAYSDFDLAEFYREQGFSVVFYEVDGRGIRSPMAMSNCVGLVKAVLGIQAPFIWTPYQLFRRLSKGAEK